MFCVIDQGAFGGFYRVDPKLEVGTKNEKSCQLLVKSCCLGPFIMGVIVDFLDWMSRTVSDFFQVWPTGHWLPGVLSEWDVGIS